MIRTALLLCAGLLAALCFACVQQTAVGPPPPPPKTRAGTLAIAGCDPSTPTSFAPLVTMLAQGYNPANFGAPPLSSPPTQPSAQIQGDLTAAFTAAPMDFRAALCGLTAVYIDPSNTFSWGFRDPYTPTNRYIGLSEQYLWGSAGTTTPPVYSQAETNLLAQVMAGLPTPMPWPPSPPPPAPQLPNAPTFSTALNGTVSVDTASMTVLAALAHEFGHVLWYDLIKASNGDQYDPTKFCQGSGMQFFKNSWAYVSTPSRWVGFPTQSGDHATGVTKLVYLQNALNSNPPDFKAAARLLNSLYANENNGNKSGVWGSLFGAISPEEDFAETFKIYIMTRDDTNNNQPVTSMALNIFSQPGNSPKYTPDLYLDLYSNGSQHHKQELTRKITCINDSFSLAWRLRR